jgi:hypothetical protein
MSVVKETSERGRTGRAAVGSGRQQARLAAAGGAIVAALAVWFVAEVVLGLDLRQPAASVGEQTADVDAVHVAFGAAVGSLAGWALLAVVERLTARPRRVWTVIAVVALVVSLGGPLSGSGITASNRLALMLMHVVVAAVVVPALARTARAPR